MRQAIIDAIRARFAVAAGPSLSARVARETAEACAGIATELTRFASCSPDGHGVAAAILARFGLPATSQPASQWTPVIVAQFNQLTPEQLSAMRAEWEALHQGPSAGQAIVLPVGVTWTPVPPAGQMGLDPGEPGGGHTAVTDGYVYACPQCHHTLDSAGLCEGCHPDN